MPQFSDEKVKLGHYPVRARGRVLGFDKGAQRGKMPSRAVRLLLQAAIVSRICSAAKSERLTAVRVAWKPFGKLAKVQLIAPPSAFLSTSLIFAILM